VLISLYRTGVDSPDVVKVNVDTGSLRTIVPGQDHIATWKTLGSGEVRLGIAVNDGKVRTYYRDHGDQDFRIIHESDASQAGSFSVLAEADPPGILYVASSEKT